MDNSRSDRISDVFFVLGSQYYAVARHSIENYVSPLAGTLYHHSIEMFIKGALARQLSSSNLKALGHNLVELWQAFKRAHPEARLDQHDHKIQAIDRFESIRYPDSIIDYGMTVGISIGGPGSNLAYEILGHAPEYQINTNDLDDVIEAIFQTSGTKSSAYLGQIPEVYRRHLPVQLLAEEAGD